jgi:hypothetical protein
MKFYPESKLLEFVTMTSNEKKEFVKNNLSKENNIRLNEQIEKIKSLPIELKFHVTPEVEQTLLTPPYNICPIEYTMKIIQNINNNMNKEETDVGFDPYGEEYQQWYERTYFQSELEYLIHKDNLERIHYEKLEYEFYENLDEDDETDQY